MDDQTRLEQAYALIKLQDLVAARPLILAVLKKDRDNLEAWWLASFALERDADKRRALENVLRLDPHHSRAQQRLAQMPTSFQPPIPPVAPLLVRDVPKKRGRLLSNACLLRILGLVCFMLMGVIVVDNFVGGRYVAPLQRWLFGTPEAEVYIAPGGGQAAASDGVPVTHEETLKKLGEFSIGLLLQEEAHLYHFSARRGTELLIAANFSSGGNPNIHTLELWDANGRVIAQEQDMTELMGGTAPQGVPGMLLAVRSIQITTPYDGRYTVAVVGRGGGAAGNYVLIVGDVFELAAQDWTHFSQP